MPARALSDEDLALMREPPLQSRMPLRLPRGLIETVRGSCARCGEEAPDDLFRGRIDHGWAGVAIVHGRVICRQCRLVSPVLIRVHDDMSMSWVHSATGRWVRARMRPSSMLVRLRLWLYAIAERLGLRARQ